MIVFDFANLATMTNGTWLHAPADNAHTAIGVGTDTRDDLNGRAFVALRGEHFDGHNFLDDAIARGARLLIVDSPHCATEYRNVPVLHVKNCRVALQQMAASYRRTVLKNCCVIAVTGSCGKTTTKCIIDSVLSLNMRGVAAPKSFNNEIGVPLTLLSADLEDRYIICEIGTNAPGEIAALGNIAAPDIAVITSIGAAHLERFGSIEAIAHEKTSLLGCVRNPGIRIVHEDVPVAYDSDNNISLIRFGCTHAADVRLTQRTNCVNGQQFTLSDGLKCELSMPGYHNAINALAAIQVARTLGQPDHVICNGLRQAKLPSMRLEQVDAGGKMIVNDAYNANPLSMRASIQTFLEMTSPDARQVWVLGDMCELGQSSASEHRALLNWIADLDNQPDELHLVGEEMTEAYDSIKTNIEEKNVTVYPTRNQDTFQAIADQIQVGDVVLLKASRSVRLERIIDLLQETVISH